jgi:hypothetical protein
VRSLIRSFLCRTLCRCCHRSAARDMETEREDRCHRSPRLWYLITMHPSDIAAAELMAHVNNNACPDVQALSSTHSKLARSRCGSNVRPST